MNVGLSIRTRLSLVIFVGVLLPLLGALALVAASEMRSLRRVFASESTLLAELVSDYAAVEMAFEDREEAELTLGKLAARPSVMYAVLYDREGRRFASYRGPEGLDAVIAERTIAAGNATLSSRDDYLDLRQPVMHDRMRYGMLELRFSTAELRSRARVYSAVAVIAAVALAIVAMVFAIWLQRLISRPILELARMVETVAEVGDYSVRARVMRHDEIGVLANGFNAMLAEVQRRREQAEQAIDARDQFLSIASHELNTPLTSLKLSLQGLQSETAPVDPTMLRFVQLASRQADRLERLVHELLDVTRLRRGTVQLTLAEMDLGELASEVGARLAPDLERAHTRLEIEMQAPIVGLWDRSRLDQVLTNLLFNAIKFCEGKPIRVEITTSGDRARIVVRDRGRGISKERIGRVFEAYERGVSSAHFGGLGLGLFIVRSLVERHGGTVKAESAGEGTGEGSAFIVELPLHPNPHAPS